MNAHSFPSLLSTPAIPRLLDHTVCHSVYEQLLFLSPKYVVVTEVLACTSHSPLDASNFVVRRVLFENLQFVAL